MHSSEGEYPFRVVASAGYSKIGYLGAGPAGDHLTEQALGQVCPSGAVSSCAPPTVCFELGGRHFSPSRRQGVATSICIHLVSRRRICQTIGHSRAPLLIAGTRRGVAVGSVGDAIPAQGRSTIVPSADQLRLCVDAWNWAPESRERTPPSARSDLFTHRRQGSIIRRVRTSCSRCSTVPVRY
eukprot:SAG31_NODE_2981_length_4829_cov_1.746089_2_plen_183_part_00